MKKLIFVILILSSVCNAADWFTDAPPEIQLLILCRFASCWLCDDEPCVGWADFNNDGIVNWKDYSELVR